VHFMSKTNEIDEIITVEEAVENGYFFLENRKFHGPFETEAKAAISALKDCKLTKPGECRAIYQGSIKRNIDTDLNEPLGDMRQVSSVECPSCEVTTQETLTDAANA